jgi:hypothetical protein
MLVDATERPDLMQALLDGSLDRMRCPKCHAIGPAATPLMFHDAQRRKLYFAPAPNSAEHEWREQAQTLLTLLIDALPEEGRLPYLAEIMVEGDLAGMRRSIQRRMQRGASPPPSFGKPIQLPETPTTAQHVRVAQPQAVVSSPPAQALPNPDLSPLLEAIQALLSADSDAEFREVVEQYPALIDDGADSMIVQLIEVAYAQDEREVAEALRNARVSLGTLRQLVAEDSPSGSAPPPPPEATDSTEPPTELSVGAYQRLLLADSSEALLDATRDHPTLLEPWANVALSQYADLALENGNERLTTLIEERSDALAALRAQLSADAALLPALRQLLNADDDDLMAQVISENPMLLTSFAQDALFGLAAGARAQGDEAQAEYAIACRAMLQRVRAELEH